MLTQYKAHSLILHIQKGWGFLRGEFGEFVELWPAQQRVAETAWYAGTADAVFQNLDIIRNHNPDYVLILAGDHIYKMDYGAMIAQHVEMRRRYDGGLSRGRAAERAGEFGVMSVDADNRVRQLCRKSPTSPIPSPGARIAAWPPWASMSSIAASSSSSSSRTRICQVPATTSARTSSPASSKRYRVMAYPFRDPRSGEQAYWRDVGTAGCLLGGQPGADRRHPAAQPLRRALADLDLSGAVAARQVRLRRRGPARHGGGLHGLRRLRHLRGHGAAFAAVLQRPRQFLCLRRRTR